MPAFHIFYLYGTTQRRFQFVLRINHVVRVPKTHRIDDQRISKQLTYKSCLAILVKWLREAISTHFPAEFCEEAEIMPEILPTAFDKFSHREFIHMSAMNWLKSHEDLAYGQKSIRKFISHISND